MSKIELRRLGEARETLRNKLDEPIVTFTMKDNTIEEKTYDVLITGIDHKDVLGYKKDGCWFVIDQFRLLDKLVEIIKTQERTK